MKTAIITVWFMLVAAMAYAEEKQCTDCPPDHPCSISYKASCNTCTYSTYCSDGVWKRGGWGSCTAMYCGDPVIANPFKYRDGGEMDTRVQEEDK